MNTGIIFSIVIPTYNQCDCLEKAVNSVLVQKKNYEIIIIDNYSNDGTEKLVKGYNNRNIKYFKVKNNGVIGISRNIGIKNAKGSWIAFLDSDDLWFKDKLKVIEEFIKSNPSYDVITNDEEIFYEGSQKKKFGNMDLLPKIFIKNFY